MTDRPPPTRAIWTFIALLGAAAAAVWAVAGGIEPVAAPVRVPV